MQVRITPLRIPWSLCAPFVFAALVWMPSPSLSEEVSIAKTVGRFEVPDLPDEGNKDVSGIALRGDLMLLAVDEGREIYVLKKADSGPYELVKTRERRAPPEKEGEFDLEGLASAENFIFAIGSHSQKREKVKKKKYTAAKNRDRLFETAIEPSREHLLRFEIEGDGTIVESKVKLVSLHDKFAEHPILQRFQEIPSKENGIDIEGIAMGKEGQIYLGFRGPVLRGGYVPVLIFNLDQEGDKFQFKEHNVKEDIRFVHLGGRGVRDMVRISADGEDLSFLILAGPVGDGPGSYQVYEWDGQNTVLGNDQPDAHDHAKVQCEVPPPEGKPKAKAEGIALLEKSKKTLDFVIVYDGVAKGSPTVFRCLRTSPRGT